MFSTRTEVLLFVANEGIYKGEDRIGTGGVVGLRQLKYKIPFPNNQKCSMNSNNDRESTS